MIQSYYFGDSPSEIIVLKSVTTFQGTDFLTLLLSFLKVLVHLEK